MQTITELTPREQFAHSIGSCFRTELDVAEGQRDWWMIEDLDGNEICVIQRHREGWKTSPPSSGPVKGKHETFTAALEAHVAAIQVSNGEQKDDLYWQGDGFPRWV